MNTFTIIDTSYYVVKNTRTNQTWICKAKRFDYINKKLYYYYGTYELGSNEHKKNKYLSDSYYDIISDGHDEIHLATTEEINILRNILEKNNIVITLQEAKDKAKAPDLKGEDFSNRRFGYKIPDGYEFNKVENGKIILKPIKPKYPTTYAECCEVLNFCGDYFLTTYDAGCMDKREVYGILQQVNSLTRLLICKSAYYKIAGEEMGLGKPWEPDYNSGVNKYGIIYMNGMVQKSNPTTNCERHLNKVLDFPTEEMRDVFYENFKDLIESCKELL